MSRHTFYLDHHRVNDAVVVYRRADLGSDSFYARLTLPGPPPALAKPRSTRTSDLGEAIVIVEARAADARARLAPEAGAGRREPAFREVAAEFLTRDVARIGSVGKRVTYERAVKQQLVPFFGDLPMGAGGHDRVEDFKNRRLHDDDLAASSVDGELTVLRELFRFAARRRRMTADQIPMIDNVSPEDQVARRGFSKDEIDRIQHGAWRRFTEAKHAFLERLDAPSRPLAEHRCTWWRDKLCRDRFLLWAFVAIMRSTGARPSSLRRARWGHFRRNERDQLLIKLSTRKGKGRRAGKTMAKASASVLEREIVFEGATEIAFVMLHETFTEVNGVQTVMVDGEERKRLRPPRHGEAILPVADPSKGFEALLVDLGLLHEPGTDVRSAEEARRARRTPYSIRHFYITQKLREGVPIEVVARNTLTSVQMIARYYDHVRNDEHYGLLSGEARANASPPSDRPTSGAVAAGAVGLDEFGAAGRADPPEPEAMPHVINFEAIRRRRRGGASSGSGPVHG